MSITQPHADELFGMLESCDVDVEEIKALIHENLTQAKDASYLNSLVEFYMNNGYSRCQEILVGICEPHDKHLFDKLNDCLKGPHRFRALTLLSHIAHKQPSWLHKISQHSLLCSIIKILKTDTEISNLMTAVLLIVTLFPVIPATIGFNHIGEILDIFTRLATFNTKKPANVPDVILMHFNVALYALFHRLYNLFPCNFLTYLRNYCYSHRDHLQVFNHTIKPMLDHVRMHPMLVTYTKEAETAIHRWKFMETHDIVIECSRLSLDPIEGTREDTSADSLTSALRQLRYSLESEYLNVDPPAVPTVTQSKAAAGSGWESVLERGAFDLSTWSPAVMCGISSPPIKTSPEFEYSGVAAGLQTLGHPGIASGFTQGEKSNVPKKEISSGCRPKEDVWLTSMFSGQVPVPQSPLKLDSGAFKFSEAEFSKLHRSNSHSKADAALLPTKLHRIPLSKASGSAAHSSVYHRPEESADVKHEKHDAADIEVEAIIEQGNSNLENLGSLGFRSTPMGFFNRSGRGSAQWSQSPFFDYIQEAQRGRSYSMGKKIPRRATVEVSRRGSFIIRSRSLPDLASQSNEAEKYFYHDKTEESAKIWVSNINYQTGEKRSLLQSTHLLAAALPQVYQSSLLHKPSSSGLTCAEATHSSPSFVQLSPPEILDRYLQLCCTAHASKSSESNFSGGQLSRPVSSQGVLQEDILRAQLQLMHIQLLFERHKREIHAERNRRLLGKAKRAKTLEEQNNAVKDQMKLLEKEISRVSAVVAELKQEKFDLVKAKERENRKIIEEMQWIIKEKIKFERSEAELQRELEAAKKEKIELQKDLEKLQSELFNCHHELTIIQDQVAANLKLKEEVVKLTRELLLMTELNKKYHERVSALQNNLHYEFQLSSLHEAYNKELFSLRLSLETRDAQYESTKTRNAELEGLIIKKDKIITEQKNLMKDSKEEYDKLVRTVEEKYDARGAICQRLEADILRLYSKMEIRSSDAKSQRGLETRSQRFGEGATHSRAATARKPEPMQFPVDLRDADLSHLGAAAAPDPSADVFSRRRVSEPIDIEPSNVDESRSHYHRLEQRFQKRYEDEFGEVFDRESVAEKSSSDDALSEKSSGALESITPQSLTSIVDIED